MISINKINQIFERFGSWIIRLRYVVVAVFILALVFGFAGLKKIQTDAGWDKWLLDSSKLKMAEDEFKEIFGNNDYVGVLVQSDRMFDPDTLALIRALGKARLLAIGPATGESLKAYGLRADLVHREYSTEGIAKEMASLDLKGARVLLPRTNLAGEGLGEGLRALGARVDQVVAYRTRLIKEKDREIPTPAKVCSAGYNIDMNIYPFLS